MCKYLSGSLVLISQNNNQPCPGFLMLKGSQLTEMESVYQDKYVSVVPAKRELSCLFQLLLKFVI